MPKNQLTDQDLQQLQNSFTYHAPKDDQTERYAQIREVAKLLVKVILECAPHSRERSIAITQIELGVAMANKAIACNE